GGGSPAHPHTDEALLLQEHTVTGLPWAEPDARPRVVEEDGVLLLPLRLLLPRRLRKKFKVPHLGQSNRELDRFHKRRNLPLRIEFIVSKAATRLLQWISPVIHNSNQAQTGILLFGVQLHANRVPARTCHRKLRG